MAACDQFIYIELLREDVVATTNGEPSAASVAPLMWAPAVAEPSKKPKAGFIANIMYDIADEDGCSHLGALGANITNLRPDFAPRTHGYKKLSGLIKGYPQSFELQARGASGSTAVMCARHEQPSK